MTKSTTRVQLRDRLEAIDLTWVDWGKLSPLVNIHINTLYLIRDKKPKSIISNMTTKCINCVLFGFEIPFKDLPKYIQKNEIINGVIRYRLEVGR